MRFVIILFPVDLGVGTSVAALTCISKSYSLLHSPHHFGRKTDERGEGVEQKRITQVVESFSCATEMFHLSLSSYERAWPISRYSARNRILMLIEWRKDEPVLKTRQGHSTHNKVVFYVRGSTPLCAQTGSLR